MKDKNDINMESLDERVEKFLRNEMSASEIEDFKTELKSNTELAERAKTLSLLVKSIKEVGRRQDQKIIDSVLYPKKRHTHVYKLYSSIVAIAASLLLLVGIGDFFIARHRTIDLATTYIALAPKFDKQFGSYKGGETDSLLVSDLQVLFEAIKEGENLEQSIHQLSGLFEQALSDKVNPYTEYSDYIGYHLAIAYLHDNNRKEARRVLVRVLEVYPNFEAAQKLLIEIDKIKGLW